MKIVKKILSAGRSIANQFVGEKSNKVEISLPFPMQQMVTFHLKTTNGEKYIVVYSYRLEVFTQIALDKAGASQLRDELQKFIDQENM